MFCNNCGKIVDGKSLFCTWCGSKLDLPKEESVEGQADSVKVEVAETVSLNKAEKIAEAPENQENAARQSDSQAVSEENKPEQSAEDLFEQEHGGSIPFKQPDADFTVNVPMGEPLIQQPKKYYTGGQMAICLVITGIMATAAGVFAALYFSAVL